MKFLKLSYLVFVLLFFVNISSTIAATYTLKYGVMGLPNGAIGGTISGTTTQTVASGENGTTVIAVPNTGYTFTSWSDGGMNAQRTDVLINKNVVANAKFTPNPMTVVYTADTGGTINGSKTKTQTILYDTSGTEVNVIPDAGYTFIGWDDKTYSVAEACEMVPLSRIDHNVKSNISATAKFVKMAATITPSLTSCTIPDGSDSCTKSFTWNVTTPIGPTTGVSVGYGVGSSCSGAISYSGTNDANGVFQPFPVNGAFASFPVKYQNNGYIEKIAYVRNNNVTLAVASIILSCNSGSELNSVTKKCSPIIPVGKPDLMTQISGPQNPPTEGKKYEIKAGIVNTELTDVPTTFTSIVQTATGFDNFGNPINLVDQPFLINNIVSLKNPIKLPLRFDAGGNSLDGYSFDRLIDIPTSVNNFDFRLCVDKSSALDGGTIDEMVENNNCTGWFNTVICPAGTVWNNACVVPPSPTIDIVVASSVTPTSVEVNTNTTFSADIKNVGNTSTLKDFNNFYQIALDKSDESTYINKTSSVMSTLTPNAIGKATVDHKFLSTGTYYIRVCADKSSSTNTGLIDEGPSEGNNCGEWAVISVYSNSTLCLDNTALNYNLPLPCIYDPAFCKNFGDPNYGKGPCTKSCVCINGATNPYCQTLCLDMSATNNGLPWPCIYDPKFCTDPKDPNYGIGECLKVCTNGATNYPSCDKWPDGDCLDKIKNGDEKGIDCGGRCLPKACKKILNFIEI